MPTRVPTEDTTAVDGTVKALRSEHLDGRDGIWVLFEHDDGTADRWYIDFLDEYTIAVTGELQLLRDALTHGLPTTLLYTDEPEYTQRVIHSVRVNRL